MIDVIQLPPVTTMEQLTKIGNYDEKTLLELMHSDDFSEVGYRTKGGQYRFFTADLKEYLKRKTKWR